MPDELREWMDKNCGGCPRAERSTESYALEYLKTFKANLEYHQMRTQLLVIQETASNHVEWLKGLLPRAIEVAEKINEMERCAHDPKSVDRSFEN